MIAAINTIDCVNCNKTQDLIVAQKDGWDWIEPISEQLCPCGETIRTCSHQYKGDYLGRCPECQEYDIRELNGFMPIYQPEQLALF